MIRWYLNGKVREDGVMLHDILLLQAKKPEEFKGEWDLFKIVKVTPGEQAFRPIEQGNCPYLKEVGRRGSLPQARCFI